MVQSSPGVTPKPCFGPNLDSTAGQIQWLRASPGSEYLGECAPPLEVRLYLQALVCLSNREIVDASRGQICNCKMANNRFFSNCVGLIYLAI